MSNSLFWIGAGIDGGEVGVNGSPESGSGIGAEYGAESGVNADSVAGA